MNVHYQDYLGQLRLWLSFLTSTYINIISIVCQRTIEMKTHVSLIYRCQSLLDENTCQIGLCTSIPSQSSADGRFSDTDATDDEVDSPGLNDKEPDPPKKPPGTREMAPDRPDENTDLEKEKKEKDDDNDSPVSNWDPVTNVGTSTDVGSSVDIGDNSPFVIGNTKIYMPVDTDIIMNVGDIVNPHINNGDESTVLDEGTDDEGGVE
jgi:hypothetical protein